jgi:hypothetical protein
LAIAFDEGTGDIFNPTVGPGTGVVTPGYGQWIPGPHAGTALGRYSTGSGDYDINPCALLTGVSSLNTAAWPGFTVMAWVRLHDETTSPRWPLLLLNGATTEEAWMGWEVPYNSESINSWVNDVAAFGSGAAPQDTWVHLCTTWDGTTRRVYSNAVLTASTTVAGPLDNTTAIAIGSSRFNYGAQGVDDLRIYNMALNATQITTLMGQGV